MRGVVGKKAGGLADARHIREWFHIFLSEFTWFQRITNEKTLVRCFQVLFVLYVFLLKCAYILFSQIVSQKDEHCWIGELNGLRGWFPAKFVELLDERSKSYSCAGDDTVSEVITDLVRGV